MPIPVLSLIDSRTMILTGAFTSVALGLALGILVRSFPHHVVGVGRWAAACLLGGAGSILIGLRYVVPDFASYVLGVGGVLAAHALQYDAIKRFRSEPVDERALFGLAALGICAFAIAWAAGDVFYTRVVVFTALGAAFLALAARALLSGSHGGRPGFARVTGVALALCALSSVVRGVVLLAAGPTASPGLSTNPVALVFIAIYVMCTMVASVGFILMTQDRLREEVETLATLDPLTGVFNRRAFIELAERELARSARAGTTVALVMLDVDHFKAVNDRLGHAAGDAVLQAFPKTAQGCLRREDTLARHGGEEFCILLPGTSLDEALAVAERVRVAVAASPVEHNGARIAYSISAGVADTVACGRDLDRLLSFADHALYAAKRSGRNRSCTVRDDLLPLAGLETQPAGA